MELSVRMFAVYFAAPVLMQQFEGLQTDNCSERTNELYHVVDSINEMTNNKHQQQTVHNFCRRCANSA